MAAQQSFRSALNGFNREDVVHYIEKVNAQHTSEINQLNSELKYLQDKLAELESQPAPVEEADTSAQAELEQQLDDQAQRIRDLFDRCQAAEAARDAAIEEKQAAEALCAEAEAECASLKAQLDAKLAAEADAQIQQLKANLEAAQNETQAAKASCQEADAEISRLKAELEALLRQQAAAVSHKEEELAAYRRAERVERQAKERAEQMCRQIDGALADTTVKVDEAASHLGDMADQVLHQLSQLQLAVSGSKLMLKDAAASLYAIRPAAEEE